MAQEETTQFSVSDKRTAHSDLEDKTTPEEGDTVEESEMEEGVENEIDAGSEADPAGGKLPDPMMLLSMAAMQLNPVQLATLMIPLFDGQARVALGLIANYATGQQEANLVHAQLAIDSMAFFLGKATTELDSTEMREMQRRLNDLRLNYLERAKNSS